MHVAAVIQSLHPAAVAGSLTAISLFLVLDALLIANRETYAMDRFSFTMVIPVIFSVVGLVVVNLTQPSDFHDITTEAAKARGFLFTGWVLMLGASLTTIVQCGLNFVGVGTRSSTFPGVALVLATTTVPLATVALWWSKGIVSSSSDDFEW